MRVYRDRRMDTQPVEAAQNPKRRGRRALWWSLPIVVVLGGAGALLYRQVSTTTSAAYTDISRKLPTAERLTAGTGEQLFRIDPTRSKVTYAVDEQIIGFDASRATGSTSAMAGDVALNAKNPSASRVGTIVVNVEQLHSDNRLRDARIRQDFLESHANPLATFSKIELAGLPAVLTPGQSYDFVMRGKLKVRGVEAPVEWKSTGRQSGDEFVISAKTTVKMSTFGVGPISLVGLVSTSDDVALSMDITAVDAAKLKVPEQLGALAGPAKSGTGPSYKNEIEPVLAASCAACHAKGEVGGEHWQLQNAGDASRISEGIGAVVASKYMPPWPASDVGVPLAHSKALDAATIAKVVAWAKAGGQLDVPANTPIRATRGTSGTAPVPRADLTLQMPKAYTGTLAVTNDYRCFILDPKLTKPTFITGYKVTPGQRSEIHHAQIFHVPADATQRLRERDGEDGRPGWTCYGGTGGPGRRPAGAPKQPFVRRGPRESLIAGWVPGQDPTAYPQNSGVLLQPGDVLVLQMHYHYETTPLPDRTKVALELEPGTADRKALEVVNPIGPVELPCDPGQTAPLCNRAAALAKAGQDYGAIGAMAEGGLLTVCGKTADELAANYVNGKGSTTCDYAVRTSGQLVGFMGHMHTLGSAIRLTLDPESPKPTILLDIPHWNFGWQMNYGPQTPIHVTAGQTFRMTCEWDRHADPTRPQKYVIFAEGTEDEMCFSTYTVIPDAPTPKS